MPVARLNKLHKPAERTVSIIVLLCSFFFASPTFADQAKVAFIGDQGTSIRAREVLELIRDEGTELLLIQGDLGYEDNSAQQWIDNIDEILGDDFPVLMVVGNHENFEWDKYLDWQKDRLAKVNAIRCEGDISVKAYCTYKDIGVVQVAPAITEVEGINGDDDYAGYITEQFQSDDSVWRICSFHKNMRDMQVGGKGDATGWGVYQNCLAEGAIVVNGHEHSYSRTHLMSDFENLEVVHRGSDMEITLGESITIVSGLGGREIRPQQHGGDWFASIYTSSQNANFGALFCDFDGATADCYMKDVAGLIPDVFTLSSGLSGTRNLELDEVEAERESQEAEAQAQREREEAEAQAQREREEAEEQAQREREEAEEQAQREREEAEAEAQAQREREEAEAEAQAQSEREEAEAEAQAQREREEAEAEAQAQREREEAEAEAQAQREREEAEAQAQREREEAEAEAQAQREREEAEAEAQAQREREEAEAQAQREREEAEAEAQQNIEEDESQNSTEIAEANPIIVGVPIGIADSNASRNVDGSLPPPNEVVNNEAINNESENPIGNVDSISADVAANNVVASAGASGGALHWIVLFALVTLALIRHQYRAFKQ